MTQAVLLVGNPAIGGAAGSNLLRLEWPLTRGTRAQEEGNCKVTILPKQSDIDLLARLIDIRDSADLAGHTDDLFRQWDPQGAEAVVFGPGRNNRQVISKIKMRRLRDLGLFYVIDGGSRGSRSTWPTTSATAWNRCGSSWAGSRAPAAGRGHGHRG